MQQDDNARRNRGCEEGAMKKQRLWKVPILDDKEVLKKRRCNTITRSHVQQSRVNYLRRGRERVNERVRERERERACESG